jgi:hypothetical protein
MSSGLEEDLRQGLTGDGASDSRDVTQGEHNDDQEGESKGGAVCQSLKSPGSGNDSLEHDTIYPVRQRWASEA